MVEYNCNVKNTFALSDDGELRVIPNEQIDVFCFPEIEDPSELLKAGEKVERTPAQKKADKKAEKLKKEKEAAAAKIEAEKKAAAAAAAAAKG